MNSSFLKGQAHISPRRTARAWTTHVYAALALALLCVLASYAVSAQTVRVTINMGEFVVELQPDRAPLTVANFLRYVNEGFYTNTLFHRVVGNFVIQGGGHSSTDYKLKPTHDPVVNESGNGLQNKRATVGIARSGSPHSANSQFYVNLADNPELDPLPTRWGFTVFGHVTQGMDVVDKIGVIATGSFGPFKSEAPLKPVIIEKIELLQAGTSTPVSGETSVNPAVMPSSDSAPTPPAAAPGSPPPSSTPSSPPPQ
ncbi:MAG TPA: peptidylprolyl isomerase [Steroidobacteraceae bacterium]|nr:peptidylprolyl isomerase [Steroidobacteraceae bacterium]